MLEAAKVSNSSDSNLILSDIGFQALYTQNLQISIPITVVVGLLLLAILIGRAYLQLIRAWPLFFLMDASHCSHQMLCEQQSTGEGERQWTSNE